MRIKELVYQTKVYECLDCGVCTGSCPVSRVLPTFSPRLMVEKSLLGKGRDVLVDQNLWSCLTCSRCAWMCPSKVDYLEFIRNLRSEALKIGNYGLFTHDGIIEIMMKIQSLGTPHNKIGWAKEIGRIAEEGEYYYFVGCLPFFDVIFEDINVDSLDSARNILKILNKMGIEPVISNDERCCGHDMLWNGDLESFKKLATLNIDLIKQKGSKKVIFACPEGYLTFKRYYPAYFGELGFEVIYFYEFILDRLKTGQFELSEIPESVTYHDPCRLGRFLGIYETPREVIRSVSGVNFVEMERNRENSTCCGTTGWVNCSSYSKEIQVERLREAKATGANILITACPKCQIHISCALLGSELTMEVKDLSRLLAAAIGVWLMEVRVSKDVLVIGGGIAGMQASLDLADQGIKVHLVERLPSIGGKMAQLDKTFPTNDCAMWIIGPKLLAVGRHPNINLIAYSEMEEVKGEVGNFAIKVRKKARYVEEDRCIGCGLCAEKCPTKVPDEYNMGLGKRKAIYKYFPQGIPAVFTIDPLFCRTIQGKKCGICKKVCEAKAINFEQKDKVVDLNVGAIILATGYEIFDPSVIEPYRYKRIPNVITSIEFERLLSATGPTAGHLERPSDMAMRDEIKSLERRIAGLKGTIKAFEERYGKSTEEFYREYKAGQLGEERDYKEWAKAHESIPELNKRLEELKAKEPTFHTAKSIAFVQCTGSRDLRFNFWCCSYGCMHSVKEAICAKEHEPEMQSYVFHMDLRAFGKGFDQYSHRGAVEYGVNFIRGRVAEIAESGEDNKPLVWYEDTTKREVKKLAIDLVVLATACVPSKGIEKLSQMMGFALDEAGFVKTYPTSPVDTTVKGIFVCGCAQGPMDIPDSVSQASGAASRAAEVISKYG